MKIQQLLESLTVDVYNKFIKETDSLAWIEYTLLDPNNLSRKYAERVESYLLTTFESVPA